MTGDKLMMFELVHLDKQCRSKGDAARFVAETLVGLQLRLELSSVRANGSGQENPGEVICSVPPL